MTAIALKPSISFSRFYASRIRRLFPALFVTLLFSAIGAFVFLGPESLIDFVESAIASVISISNLYFWTQAGYWDTAAHVKPLLHTWSLSVEEQFYLIWPLLIMAWSSKFSRKNIILILGLVSILSLGAAEFAVSKSPSMAFYLTPFRVYEFAIGGLCFFINWPSVLTRGLISEILGVLGVVAIFATSVVYDGSTPFPGFTALLPCLGAAAIIIASQSSFNRVVLGNRLMIGIGLISYSLYLAHWPIFVFYKIHFGDDLSLVEQCGLIVATFVVAYLLFKFIEKPLRRPKAKANRTPASASLIGLVAMSAAFLLTIGSVVTISNDGFPGRYSKEISKFANLTKSEIQADRIFNIQTICGKNRLRCGKTIKGKNNILIVGDSLAVDGFIIVNASIPNANYLLSGAGGCPPFQNLEGLLYGNKDCGKLNKKRFKWIDSFSNKPDGLKPKIVVSARLSSERSTAERSTAVVEFVTTHINKGFDVVVLGVGPHYTEDARDTALRHGSIVGLDEALTRRILPNIFEADRELEVAVTSAGGTYIGKLGYLCPEQTCKALTESGELFIYDNIHMTFEGANELGENLEIISALK